MKEKLVEDLRKLVCELCDDNLEFCYTCCIEEEIFKILNENGIELDINYFNIAKNRIEESIQMEVI